MTRTHTYNRILVWGLAAVMLATLLVPVTQVGAVHDVGGNINISSIYGTVRDVTGNPVAGIRMHICSNLTSVPTPGSCLDKSDVNRTTNSDGHWWFNFVNDNKYYVVWTGLSAGGSNAQSVFYSGQQLQVMVPDIIDMSGSGTPNFQLSVDVVGNGSVTSSISGISCGSIDTDCEHFYIDGSILTLTATPDTGKAFISWSGDCAASGSASVCPLVVDRTMFVVANFSGGTQSSNFGSISGTVTLDNGELAVGVKVQIDKLSGSGVKLVTWFEFTDGLGNYASGAPLPLGYSYNVLLPDYSTAVPTDWDLFLSSAGPMREDTDFEIPADLSGQNQEGENGVIFGYVKDSGNPLPFVSVKVERVGSQGGGEIVQTGTDGQYIVNGLHWPAQYRIDLLPVAGVDPPDQFRTLDVTATTNFANFFLDLSTTEPIEPPTTGEDGTLSGTFSLLNGSLAFGVPIKVYAFDGTKHISKLVDASSASFSIALSPGAWFIGYELLDDAYAPISLSNASVVIAPGQVLQHNIIIQKSPSTAIVTVKKSDGTLFAGAWVKVSRFSLTAETGEFTADNSTLEQERFGKETGINGQVTFKVPPGTWYIRVHAPQDVSRINPREEVVVIGDGQTKQLTMQFRTRDATLKGRVLDNATGAPIEAFVGAWSESGGFAEGRSNADGFYELKVLGGEIWHIGAMANVSGILHIAYPIDVPVDLSAIVLQNLIVKQTSFNIPPPIVVTHAAADSFVEKLENNTQFECEVGGCFDDDEPIEIHITPDIEAPDQGGTGVIGMAYKIEAFGANSREAHTTLKNPARITIPYLDSDITERGVLARDLKIGFFDEAKGTWVELTDCAVDTSANLVTCTTDHLTRFALLTPSYASVVGTTILEGDLVRGPDGVKVWIVNADGYKRHIFNPAVFGMYGHFIWNNIVEVSQSTLDSYSTSDLYRALGDDRVFVLEEIDEAQGLADKRWLNFSADEFLSRGYTAVQIFQINPVERDFYQEGLPIS